MSAEPFKIACENGELEYKVSLPVGMTEEEERAVDSKFLEFVNLIKEALFNNSKTWIHVELILDMGGKNVHVYPSQLFSDDKEKRLYSLEITSDGKKTKAGMTSQKISNALKTFDVFYTAEELKDTCGNLWKKQFSFLWF